MRFMKQLQEDLGVKAAKLINEKRGTQVYQGALKGEEVIVKIHAEEKYFWRELLSLRAMSEKNFIIPKLISYGTEFKRDGFGYLVWKKIQGENLLSAYNKFEEKEKEQILYQCGQFLGELNRILSFDEIKVSQLWQYTSLENENIKFDSNGWKNYFINQIPKWITNINQLEDPEIDFSKIEYLILENLKIIETKKEELGLVHRDYGFRNILIRDKSIVGIIDFEHAIIGDILFDVAKLLFNSLRCDEVELSQKFLRGWEERANLRVKREKLFLFLAIQSLGAMQWVDSQKFEIRKENIEYRKKAKKTLIYSYHELKSFGR